MTKWQILEFSRNLFQCFFLKYKTETAKTVQRQLHILHNISKFRHFVISSHLFYWHANHIRILFSFSKKYLWQQTAIYQLKSLLHWLVLEEFWFDCMSTCSHTWFLFHMQASSRLWWWFCQNRFDGWIWSHWGYNGLDENSW